MRQSHTIVRRFVNNLGGLPDKRLPAFVVANMGRAGSGLLHRALIIGARLMPTTSFRKGWAKHVSGCLQHWRADRVRDRAPWKPSEHDA